MIYVIQLDDGSIVHAYGTDKNEAWAKVGFAGDMIDSMTVEEYKLKQSNPEVL